MNCGGCLARGARGTPGAYKAQGASVARGEHPREGATSSQVIKFSCFQAPELRLKAPLPGHCLLA
jgi:hypothetical protein